MSIRKNTWDLDGHYDLTKSGQNDYLGASTLFVMGYNADGRLGQNNRTQYSSPVQIPGTSWSFLCMGDQSSGAIKTDGTLWSWGYNQYGQLGQSNKTPYSSPVQIPGNSWHKISIGWYDTSIATKTDGTLWAWGNNSLGQLGQSDKTPYSSPVQIPGTQWEYDSLSANYGHWFCKKTDGTLWACGYNYLGYLGRNDRTWQSSPVQVPGTQWQRVEVGYGQILATKTDGTLWAWGNNSEGALGQNNLTRYSSPVQIPGTNWSLEDNAIGGGRLFSAARKTDGTLWSWGYNGEGNLGQGNTIDCSSPVQIPGTSWKDISVMVDNNAYTNALLATKTDGTLWSWGYNGYGKLGQNNQTQYSSPVQIPGTQWSSPSVGENCSGALIAQ